MSDEKENLAHWSRVAGQWIAWARSPNHDAFWAYRKSLAAFIGRGTGEALEVGCGEGRVSRELKALGYRVLASDLAPEMVKAAAERSSGHFYAVADAASLPFANRRFELIVAYNVLMDVPDATAAVKEMARVLHPDGRLVVSIVHPFVDRGSFVSDEPGAPFVVAGQYFERRRFAGVEERGGLRMEFAGWSQPLEAYVDALQQSGLAITSLREPMPEQGEQWRQFERWTRLPLFLWLTARPRARSTA